MIRRFALAALALAACGLISSDVTQLKLHMPAKDFSVDTAKWNIPPGAAVPIIPCGGSCAAAGAALCDGGGCSAQCNDATGQCEGHEKVAIQNDYNLAQEAPEFQSLADQSVLSVAVDAIYFDIGTNTLNVDTPEMQVVFGPQSITAASDPGAELVGTIPVLKAGTTGRVNVVFAPQGQAVMKKYFDNFKTPFRVLVVGEFVMRGGQPIPAGKLVGAVQGDAHVSLGK
jgi:hypothetical protein